MIKTKRILNLIVLPLFLASYTSTALSMPANNSTMAEYYKENEKFTCSPEELADYLVKKRKSLEVAPNIVDADTFISNENKKKKDDPDNCNTLFEDLKVVEEIKKLIEKIKKLEMPSFGDGSMMESAKLLAQKLYENAMESICNALTKEAAEKLIDEIMNRELGFDMGDVKEFDAKEFAKDMAMDHAGEYLESKGIDKDWLDEDEHQDLMSDEIGNHKDKMVDRAFPKK